MSFKPIDSRRDEFRKYLERSGVVDEMTKVLIKLFNTPERPENAIEFILENMGHTLLHEDQYEYLKKELEESRNEISNLKHLIEKLRENSNSNKIQNNEEIQSKIETTVHEKKQEMNIIQEELQQQNTVVNGDASSIAEEQIVTSEIQEEQITTSSSKVESEPVAESVVDNNEIESVPLSPSKKQQQSQPPQSSSQPSVTQENDVKDNSKIDVAENYTPTSTTDGVSKKSDIATEEKIENKETVKAAETPKNNEEVITSTSDINQQSAPSKPPTTTIIPSSESEESINKEKPSENKNIPEDKANEKPADEKK